MSGLSSSQYTVLLLIGDDPGSSQADLSRDAGVDERTMSDILTHFHTKKWVKIGQINGREHGVWLTESGEAALSDARVVAAAIEQSVVRGLPGNTLPTVTRALGVMAQHSISAIKAWDADRG